MNKETCMSDTAMHSCYLDLDKSSKYQNQGKGISLCLDLTAVNSYSDCIMYKSASKIAKYACLTSDILHGLARMHA